jgi:hypothetical protein
MRRQLNAFLMILSLVLLLPGCGSVSGLTRESAGAPRIADFDRVEVLDFEATGSETYEDAAKQADYDASLAEAKSAFADRIAEAVRESGAFAEVTREAGDGPALRISGRITRYDEGNLVARGLTGFAGKTHFDAEVSVADAGSGQVLATLTIDRNSWPLPVGASTATIQTTNFFMKEAARKIASELEAKKKAKP